MKKKQLWIPSLLLCLALVLAGCGSSGTAVTRGVTVEGALFSGSEIADVLVAYANEINVGHRITNAYTAAGSVK